MTATDDDDGRRLDRVIRKARADVPLSAIHRLFRARKILLDGQPAGPATRVRAGQEILAQTAEAPPRAAAPPPAAPPRLDIRPLIIRETPRLLFLNKPANLTVHGPGSLDEAVRAYLEGSLSPSLSFRPGPLHRLDRNTSGVITFSKSLRGARDFSAALREGRVKKSYLALLEGRLETRQIWEDALLRDNAARKTLRGAAGRNGRARQARSEARPLRVTGGHTLAEIIIHTGITHQIRAQAALRGFPLAGDRKYGSPNPPPYLLHAARLEVPASLLDEPPAGGQTEPAIITAPLPPGFAERGFAL